MMQLPAAWPMDVQARVKWDIYTREIAASLSMKLPFMMTDEEWQAKQEAIAKAQQEAQMAEAAKDAVPEVIKQGGLDGLTK